jgi:4-deoxy-L-threo-5-hexosulose-uronate ketol-isomerase
VSLNVETRHAIDPETARGFDTDALRKHFHVGGIFVPGQIRLIYTHYDRMIVGGAVPDGGVLTLDEVRECGTPSILDRREMVVVNIGGDGTVEAAGERHEMVNGDMLYLGMGSGSVGFGGAGRFYILSAPAHATHPTRLIRIAEAATVTLGSAEASNARTIYQFVHPDVMTACQLVVGMTKLEPGSVWNTMPAHVHDRRMEAYLYVALPGTEWAIHLIGEPDETRHLVLANEEGALSPPWSIHAGAGTSAYTFIWAMAGDNVDYKDVEMVAMGDLR